SILWRPRAAGLRGRFVRLSQRGEHGKRSDDRVDLDRNEDDSEDADADSSLSFCAVRHLLPRPDQHWFCCLDNEQGPGHHQPAVWIASWNFLFWLFPI